SAGPLPSSKAARERTTASVPLPSADQLVPFHFATFAADPAPAVVKRPPTWRAGPLPSSKVARARTTGLGPPLTPPPSADQVRPFHFATCWAAWPPAFVKEPPA